MMWAATRVMLALCPVKIVCLSSFLCHYVFLGGPSSQTAEVEGVTRIPESNQRRVDTASDERAMRLTARWSFLNKCMYVRSTWTRVRAQTMDLRARTAPVHDSGQSARCTRG